MILNLVILIAIAFATGLIFVLGFRHFEKSSVFALKFLAVSLIILEIFKFFYNASIFPRYNPPIDAEALPMGDTPAAYLSLTIVTLIGVMMLFGVFMKSDNKFGVIMRCTVLIVALVPILFTIFDNSAWYRPNDTFGYLFGMTDSVQIGMIGAIYFVQCGLVLASAYYLLLGKKRISVLGLVIGLAFVGAVMGLVGLTNWLWDTNFLFTQRLHENILAVALSLTSVIGVWLLNFLLLKKNSDNTDVIATEVE